MSEHRKAYEPPTITHSAPMLARCTTCYVENFSGEPFPEGWMCVYLRETGEKHPKQFTLCPQCATNYIRALVTR